MTDRLLAETGFAPEEALAGSTRSVRQLCEAALGRPVGGLTSGRPAGVLWFDRDLARDFAGLVAPHFAELVAPQGVFRGGRWEVRGGEGGGA